MYGTNREENVEALIEMNQSRFFMIDQMLEAEEAKNTVLMAIRNGTDEKSKMKQIYR